MEEENKKCVIIMDTSYIFTEGMKCSDVMRVKPSGMPDCGNIITNVAACDIMGIHFFGYNPYPFPGDSIKELYAGEWKDIANIRHFDQYDKDKKPHIIDWEADTIHTESEKFPFCKEWLSLEQCMKDHHRLDENSIDITYDVRQWRNVESPREAQYRTFHTHIYVGLLTKWLIDSSLRSKDDNVSSSPYILKLVSNSLGFIPLLQSLKIRFRRPIHGIRCNWKIELWQFNTREPNHLYEFADSIHCIVHQDISKEFQEAWDKASLSERLMLIIDQCDKERS